MKIVDKKQPFSYVTGEVPETYKCQICGQTHVKLWRKSNTFLDQQTLVCASCLARMHTSISPKFVKTKQGFLWTHKNRSQPSDQLGDFLPAVPTEDNSTFWGYTAVPQAGCQWWKNLPDGI